MHNKNFVRGVTFISVILVAFSFSFQANASAIFWKTLAQVVHKYDALDSVDDYSCYDVFGIPHKGKIPHPSNCNYYLQCVVGNDGNPVPYLQTCESDELFDMTKNKCKCVTPTGTELCFDPEHEPIRFDCAEPVAKAVIEITGLRH